MGECKDSRTWRIVVRRADQVTVEFEFVDERGKDWRADKEIFYKSANAPWPACGEARGALRSSSWGSEPGYPPRGKCVAVKKKECRDAGLVPIVL